MVHFLVLAEFCEGDERNIREFFKNRPYLHPPYSTMQVREVKLMDFAVPEAVADSFLDDLGSQHNIDHDPEMEIRSGIVSAIRTLAKKIINLDDVDMSKHIKKGDFGSTRSKFLVLGKLNDKQKNGKEWF